jgi:hypothetical protein
MILLFSPVKGFEREKERKRSITRPFHPNTQRSLSLDTGTKEKKEREPNDRSGEKPPSCWIFR